MKRSSAVIWALALFAIMSPIVAGATTQDPSHFGLAVGINCQTCHQDNRTLGATKGTVGVPIIRTSPAVYNNICQSCHRTGDGFAKNKPMALVDTSAIFGNHSTANFGNLRQTSHRWDGSDTNPAAGAQPPIQAAMTTNTNGTGNLRGRSGYQLACVRCHAPHLANAPGAMLRMPIDEGQMCVDCHRSRDTSNTTQNPDPLKAGSHLVNINYDQQVAASNGSLKAVIDNANPANNTSNLRNYLSPSGNIICTTCHGVHYTDSRSSTFDGASTAKGKGNYTNLSTGDGYQLRTDRRGAKVPFGTPDKLNICTNCHAGKLSHNAKGQDIQCLDCHAAHVDYDATNSATINPLNLKNIDLIRRNVKNGTADSKIYFRYTGSRREYKNDSGTGVCQGCHAVPPAGGKYPKEHDSNNASDCNKCHYHGSSAGSFSGACGMCHPTTGGLATSVVTNATAGAVGAHDAHVINGLKMECSTCHDGFSGRAMPNQTIDINFAINGVNVPNFTNVLNSGTYINTAALSNGYTFAGTGVGTNGTSQTCSAIYCHGATLTGGTNTTPSWVGGSAQVYCGSCHGATAAQPPTTGSHGRHAGAAAGQLQIPCASCHGPHTDNSHVIGNVKWNMTGINGQYKTPTGLFYTVSGSTGRLAPSARYGTCNNVICHSNANPNGSGLVYRTPTWGGTVACGSCHDDMSSTPSGSPNGGHYKHASTANANGPAFDCSVCHTGYTATSTASATHANQSVDLNGTITGYSKASPMPMGGAWGTCSTNQCHGQATGLVWNNGSIWQTGGDHCTTCHSSSTPGAVTAGTPFYSTGFPSKQTSNLNAKVGAHTLHLTTTNIMGASLVCADCHGSVALRDATHMNGTTNFNFSALAKTGGLTPSYSGGVCSNVYCHGASMPYGDTTGTHRAPTWNVPFMTGTPADCGTCHGFPPAGNHPAFATPATFAAAAAICKDCHTNVNPLGTSYDTMFIDKSLHINGTVEVLSKCNGCHGYPPSRKGFVGFKGNWSGARQENYSGGGGSHTIAGHLAATISPADGWVNCSKCHNQADHNMGAAFTTVKVSINPAVRFDNGRKPVNISYAQNGTTAPLAGTCANVACHFQKTPKW